MARRSRSASPTSSPSPRIRRVGPPTDTPNGVRSASARPTRTSPPAGCPRSSPRPTPRTARPPVSRSRTSPSPSTEAFAQGRGVGRRALRRHHPDLPQQLVPGRSARQPVRLRVRRWRSRRSRSSTTTRATPTACSPRARNRGPHGCPSWRSIPRKAPSTRTTRSSCSTPRGSSDAGGGRGRQVRRLRPGARPTRRRCSRTASGRATRRCAVADPDRRVQRRRPGPAPDAPRGPQPARARPAARRTGRTSARAPACCSLVDVSGSMGDLADPETGATKLDLAKQATIDALDDFNDDDQVGLWVFTTDLPDDKERAVVDRAAAGRATSART